MSRFGSRRVGALTAAMLLSTAGAAHAATLGLTSQRLTAVQLTAAPLVAVSISTTDDKSGGPGKIDAADSTTLTFAGALLASSVCSSWTGTTGTQTAAGLTLELLNNAAASGNDLLLVTPGPTFDCAAGLRAGAVDAGSRTLTNQDLAFPQSTANLTWSATTSTVTLTFGPAPVGIKKSLALVSLTWTPDPATLHVSGRPVARGTAVSAPGVQW